MKKRLQKKKHYIEKKPISNNNISSVYFICFFLPELSDVFHHTVFLNLVVFFP